MKIYVLGKIFFKVCLFILISFQILEYCYALVPTPDDQILDLDSDDLYLISTCADTYCSQTKQPKPVVYTISFLTEMLNHFRQGNDQRYPVLFALAVRNYPLYIPYTN